LLDAQGEDVVAGIRTPEHLEKLKDDNSEVYEQLIGIFNFRKALQRHAGC